MRGKKLFLRGDFRQFSNKNFHIWDHFFPLLFPKDSESLKILDIRLREVGAKRQLKKTENQRRPKKVKKKTFFCAAILDNFQTKMFISETTSFHYFSPKDSESLKILDIQLQEVGAKGPLNGTSKVSRHTDGHTDRRTHGQTAISTYRKHRPRGPMLWKEQCAIYTVQCTMFLLQDGM